jgi:hypothetical protein
MAKGKFALPLYLGGSGGGSFIIREYTSSTVWNKPAGLLEVFVVCIGGGGAGGGAGSSAAGTIRRAGGGGCAAYLISRRLKASDLSITEDVTVGAGGIGGAGATGATGGDGTSGGVSSFGTLVVTGIANGGGGGGSNTGGGGGSRTNGSLSTIILPILLTNPLTGAASSSSGGSGGSANQTAMRGGIGIPQGAAGAGIPSSDAQTSIAGQGGRLDDITELQSPSNITSSTIGSNGGDGVDNWATQLLHQFNETSLLTIGVGASGGGGKNGNAAGTINGGNGGKGGNHGSGGGGGGAATEPAFGGSGGDGGNGCVIVMEIY